MSLQSELAFAHNKRVIGIGDLLVRRGVRLWRSQMSLANLDASWNVVAPQMVAQVTAAQLAAAKLATPYTNALDRANGYEPEPAVLVPEAFAGVMGDGREVAPALFGAVTNTKTAIGRGVAPSMAFEVGGNFIAAVMSAALHDMSRNADRVIASGKGYTRYVRVVNGSACSRCAILAGIYSSEQAFLRHVSCQCGTAAIQEGAKVPGGFHDSPEAYFESLSKADQDRVFTNAGAEAIRQGADPVKVVNARRGAYGIGYSGHHNAPVPDGTHNTMQKITIGRKADGSPLQVYATTESTTFRGRWGRRQFDHGQQMMKSVGDRYRRTTTLRLMPEQIQIMAGSDPQRYVELLQRYGYLGENAARNLGVSHIF